ncbi:unnamed protein product, partial [Mesorhabditis belari]|uniref:Transmembrane protein 144 n=1 Tax=Mesorhabditis belari TaxID=2138241 RepID=A0AAF3FCY5_9BILA
MSSAILLVGFCTFVYIGFPGFYPLAMLGGMFWSIGNSMAIPVISRLGMALGILIWNTTNCLTGWAGGRFGLFGMKANPPESSILNYFGLSLVLVGGFLFSRIRGGKAEEEPAEGKRITLHLHDAENEKLSATPEQSDDEVLNRTTKVDGAEVRQEMGARGRGVGILLALISGCFYGLTDSLYPTDGMSYIFSHYFGIFVTGTALFVGYSIFKKNKPTINNAITLPAFGGGLLWAIAQSSFFIANDNLSQAVTFPIITTLPGCVAALWSIFYFKEIQGKRNFILMAIAVSITLT